MSKTISTILLEAPNGERVKINHELLGTTGSHPHSVAVIGEKREFHSFRTEDEARRFIAELKANLLYWGWKLVAPGVTGPVGPTGPDGLTGLVSAKVQSTPENEYGFITFLGETANKKGWIKQSGDQFFRLYGRHEWRPVGNSYWRRGRYYRRPIDPGEGFELVPANEKPTEGMEVFEVGSGQWFPSEYHTIASDDATVGDIAKATQFHYAAFRRRKKTEQELYGAALKEVNGYLNTALKALYEIKDSRGNDSHLRGIAIDALLKINNP